jgi:murein DD-endopeptidase MepM/ murein hydrolase activator NlpD
VKTSFRKRTISQLLLFVLSCVPLVFLPACASPFAGRNPQVTPNIWPVTNTPPVSSEYGLRWNPTSWGIRKHKGIDIAVDKGTPVYATAPGRVVYAGWGGGFGNYVKIDHGDTLYTYYGHLSKIKVKEGAAVRRGALIAYSGNTGRVTGDHLHYQIKYRGKDVNPRWAMP